MIKEEIKKIIEKAIKKLQKSGVFPIFDIPEIIIEYPREKTHGDYSCNIALQIAKDIKKNPIDVAKIIVGLINKNISQKLFSKIEVVKPGFINFFLSEVYLQELVVEIIKNAKNFGDLNIGRDEKINVEFISANPTGPLTLGNGRGGFCGDVLANVLEKAGYKVTREYYINDTGEQIKKLGHSVLGDEEAVYNARHYKVLRSEATNGSYKGAYIEDLKKILEGPTLQHSVGEVGEKAAKYILEKMIKPSVKKMGIKFDVWFSEKSLYKKGAVDKAINNLSKRDFTYKSEGAVWFKSKDLEDDKDRVLIRTDGIRTYFASDIAYLKNKFERGFRKLIFFVGADHYGYVARLKAAITALGYEKERVDFIIMQLVRLFQEGKEVRMSKRAGTYVTLDELLDEVGLDVARFFFLQRSADTHLNFDLNLAKEQSQKNPVYYVQYANARIHSILAKSKIKIKNKKNFGLINHPSELALIKELIRFPEIIEDTVKDYQVQRLPQCAIDLADAFHRFYENCRVITENKELAEARLALILATKIVLKNTLDLMGISAPEKM